MDWPGLASFVLAYENRGVFFYERLNNNPYKDTTARTHYLRNFHDVCLRVHVRSIGDQSLENASSQTSTDKWRGRRLVQPVGSSIVARRRTVKSVSRACASVARSIDREFHVFGQRCSGRHPQEMEGQWRVGRGTVFGGPARSMPIVGDRGALPFLGTEMLV